MQFRKFGIVALLLMLAVLVACGDDAAGTEDEEPTVDDSPAGLTVRDAWIRTAVLPEGNPTPGPEHDREDQHEDEERDHDHSDHHDGDGSGVLSAMYMIVENDGSQDLQLTGVETDVARVIELHHTQNVNGLMQMRHVEAIDLPAGDEVVFEPGGFHVMLVDIQQQLEPGAEVAVTLIFSTGDRHELPVVPVRDQ